jgi:hypothetical protein
MSELLPEGRYECKIDKAEKDVLSDGREVLCLELLVKDEKGQEHRVYDVIETQEKLDEFLVSLGFRPGAMKLKQK